MHRITAPLDDWRHLLSTSSVSVRTCPGTRSATLLLLLGMATLGAGTLSASEWMPIWSVDDYGPFDSSTPKTAEVSCPSGLVAIGGGARVGAGPRFLYLLQSGAIGSTTAPDGWTAYGHELLAYIDDWEVQAAVVCGDPPGYERLSDLTGFDSSSQKALQVTCPAGKRPIGGGAKILGAPDTISLTCSALSDFRNGWQACAEELLPSSATWALLVEVLCADPPPGYTVVYESGALSTSTTGGVDVDCPPGTMLLSGGAWVSPGAGVGLSFSFGRELVTEGALASGGSQFFTRWRSAVAAPFGVNPLAWQAVTSAVCASGPLLLRDGFESGETSAWTSAVP